MAQFSSALQREPDSREWFDLRRAAERLSLVPGFDSLITLNANTIKELPHQIDVALTVLRQMGGRALLADEVGLGKTIEAGIILKELVVRGLARRILILTPAALVDQWQGELESKFFENFDAPTGPDEWRRVTRGIASYDRARTKKHREAILRHQWDLVILDEAHKLKNESSATYKFIQEIRRNYILLLTATPLQNDLRELYNLITLLRPGQLGTWTEFAQRYLVRGDRRRVKDPGALKDLTSQVMVRTRRSSVAHALELPKRIPLHPITRLTPPERALYQASVGYLRELYRKGFIQPSREEAEEDRARRKRNTGKGILTLELMRLCRRLCSSSTALGVSLERMAEGEFITPEYRQHALKLASFARDVSEHAKLQTLERLLGTHTEQVIVFSEHLPTLDLIRQSVESLGRRAVIYQGGLSRDERVKRLNAFKNTPDAVFVSTRAGTEGLNLQFCNVLVNYELPWNPMIVEQRIGRIHRIGQTRDAHIINLAAEQTIEAHVLKLLDQKIKLFELVVGELDVILGEFGGADALETELTTKFLEAGTEEEFERLIDGIGQRITASRDEGLLQEQLNSDIAADDNAMRLEREFRHLPPASRVRLGYGTRLLEKKQGVDSRRQAIGLHENEILEALEHAHVEEDHVREYGPVYRISGLTHRQRAVHLMVKADSLPMMLIEIDADAEAPLVRASS
ncbi:MAG: DEAD/DEAH box helicase [Gemmatimonadaceae bacterium]|nr:DEAD/DEAH box helicase [Gemmatimonadaceae bacterium]MCW5826837.1 DEAD/DEAH box helicase [Gemmatimonadaceae bacterium]